MTAPKLPLRRLAVALALLACAGLAATSAASAATQLSWKNGKTESLRGTGGAADTYASDRIVFLGCPGKATAVMTAWTGPKAPVAMVYSHLVNTDRMMGLAVRRSASGGKFRSRALCLSGARAQARERSSGGPVSCGAKRIALGVPIDGGPYWAAPVAAKPVGANAWLNQDQGKYARSKAICVSAKAFKQVQRISRSATFPVGRSTATVKLACKGGRRPISWGFESGVLERNVWTLAASGPISVPFISASMPQGKAGWQLTFATPDGLPAQTTAPLGIHLTCAVPA